MKPSKTWLPLTVAGLGFAACILRFCLYLFGTDEKGLLISGHPLAIALWLLTAAVAVLVILQIRPLKGSRRYNANFPVSNAAAIGCFVFAAGLFATAMANRYAFLLLEFLRNILCLLAVPSLAAVAICRRLGKRPYFCFHAIVCLALTVYTITHYSGWSSRPQLMDAFFPMMGCIGLVLFAYYQTAFHVGMGSRRMQLGTGLLAAYACFAAVPFSESGLLYLTGGIWTLTNLCVLTPPAPAVRKADSIDSKEETP